MKGFLFHNNTNFSIPNNRRPKSKFFAERVIRQGDSISPFFSTIIGDTLSCSIHYCCEKQVKGSEWATNRSCSAIYSLQMTLGFFAQTI